MIGFVIWIVVGGLAGFLAGRAMGKDFSIPMNIGLGIGGSFVANVILWFLGYSGDGNYLGQLIMGVIGACVLIYAYSEYKKRNI